uniref:Uncharacterized protein n=3 Tax=Aegilops tauschii subsp. strangulata TaxID=200361 RepID=A0A453SVT0_AEGTS
MVMDQRARPSDRTKIPEELAQEEKERLEILKERHKWMLGTAESSDEEDDDSEDGDHHMKAENSKPISGDDLGDSFSFDEPTKRKKGWVDEIYENEARKIGEGVASGDEGSDDNGEDEDEDEEEDAGDEEDSSDNDFRNMPARDWEQSDDGEAVVEEDEKDDVKDKEQVIGNKVIKTNAQNLKRVSNTKQKPHGKDEDHPFVIEAPNNLQDLCSLVDGRSETEVAEIISRIRTCNSIRLGRGACKLVP